MKKKQLCFDILFVVVITMLTCLFLLNSNLVNGDDLNYHLYRIVGLKDAFGEGQLLPKIYPYANYGFGYASPLFYCDLFLYPFALLYYFGVNLVIAYKIMIVCISLLTCISILFVAKRISKKKYTPYIISILYMCSNYRFVNMISRAAIGELFAMAFIPLCLLSIYKVLVLKEDNYFLLTISFSCLTMSHLLSLVIVASFFLVSIIIFIIRNYKDMKLIWKQLLIILKGTVFVLLVTSWYLLPMIEQMLDQEFWFSYNNYYPDLSYPKAEVMFKVFADMQGAQTVSSASLGLILIIVPFVYVFEKKDTVVNYVVIASLVLFMFASGIIIVDEIIKVIQFSFRIYSLLLPLALFIISYVLDNITNRVLGKIVQVIIIVFCLINLVIVNYNAIAYASTKYNNNSIKEEIFDNENSDDNVRNIYYNDSELSDGQYRPYEIVNYLKSATKYISYINDKNEPVELINDYDRNYSSFEFTGDFTDNLKLELPILWYKGYKGYEIINENDNYSYVPINCYMNNGNKKVMLDVEQGAHTYYVAYEGTGVQKLGMVLSSISLFIFMLINTVYKKNRIKA